jgi:hypothetical protein
MKSNGLKTYLLAALLGRAHSAVAAPDGHDASNEFIAGVLVVLLVVALAYAFVFAVRALTGSRKQGPDDMSAGDFDKLTTPSDRPSIERY